jgi:hypothetical protein
MPAVTLKDPGHVDFMLNNLRKFGTKFSIFYWVTTSFISISMIFKANATTKST